MLKVNQIAQEIYNALNISELPPFWFEYVQENQDALLFRFFESDTFNNYYDQYLYKLGFRISLISSTLDKANAINQMWQVIVALSGIWTLGNYSVIQMKINNEFITPNQQTINFNMIENSVTMERDKQIYSVKIEYLLQQNQEEETNA